MGNPKVDQIEWFEDFEEEYEGVSIIEDPEEKCLDVCLDTCMDSLDHDDRDEYDQLRFCVDYCLDYCKQENRDK